MSDAFSTVRTFTTGNGKSGSYYSLPALEEKGVGPISRLPISIRIVLESVLRNCDGKKVAMKDVETLANWNAKAPALEEIAGSLGEKVKIVKLNVDENPHTAAKYGIQSIPTLMIFKDGQMASRQIGAAPKQKLEQWITTAV